jgi:hypothetical protein
MNLSTDRLSAEHALYPHPIYGVQLNELLAGKPFHATVKRTGWLYFLRDKAGRVACAEVTVFSGRHRNVRVSEGVFVKNLFRRIDTLSGDSRIGRQQFSVKSIRAEALQLFYLWLESGENEWFVPITNSKTKKWISREYFAQILQTEGERIRQAQMTMRSLLETYQ